jgi:hypothetical protein
VKHDLPSLPYLAITLSCESQIAENWHATDLLAVSRIVEEIEIEKHSPLE